MKLFVFIMFTSCIGCMNIPAKNKILQGFDRTMVEFEAYGTKPVFTHGDTSAWDEIIRERGFILKEDSIYCMWYTGHTNHDTAVPYLGYATSADGIAWKRHPANPVFRSNWTEDMFVLRHEGQLHMFAEGYKDVAHYMTSIDGINWNDHGSLVIINTRGDTLPAPYGTPTVFVDNEKWYLFYEVNDAAIWLATSTDKMNWKNVSDEPVLKPGPESYDLGAVAVNQIVKHNGKYYMYYHASADPGWQTNAGVWSSNAAISTDLVHWTKYPGNPLVRGDHSSPVTLFDGKKMRLYTMHPNVWLFMGK